MLKIGGTVVVLLFLALCSQAGAENIDEAWVDDASSVASKHDLSQGAEEELVEPLVQDDATGRKAIMPFRSWWRMLPSSQRSSHLKKQARIVYAKALQSLHRERSETDIGLFQTDSQIYRGDTSDANSIENRMQQNEQLQQNRQHENAAEENQGNDVVPSPLRSTQPQGCDW